MIYRLFFIIIFTLSIGFSQTTGFLTHRATSGLGIYLLGKKNVDNANAPFLKGGSMSYITEFGLEFGAKYILNNNRWNQNGFDITYHFKGFSNILNTYLNYETGNQENEQEYIDLYVEEGQDAIEEVFYNNFSVGIYTGDSFYITATLNTSEAKIQFEDEIVERKENQFISIGKYFKTDSFVVGIDYTVPKDDSQHHGYFNLTLGFLISPLGANQEG